jgi:SAM-dependent methyltransferase
MLPGARQQRRRLVARDGAMGSRNVASEAWDSLETARRYERARPGYPAEAIGFIQSELGLDEKSWIVDVGAGTGKLTRVLVAMKSQVTAVEPLEAMRETFHTAVPHIEVRAGSAEALPFDAHSLDAIVAGQAWHWFDADRAIPEAERVLRPGGAVVLIWNELDTSVDWVAEYRAIRDEYATGLSINDGTAQTAFSRRPDWSPLEHRSFANRHDVSPDTLVERMLSTSYVSARGESGCMASEARVRQIVDRYGLGQDIKVPYITEVFWSRFRQSLG